MNRPLVGKVIRNLLTLRMGLRPGPFRVDLIEDVRVPMIDGITLATDHYLPLTPEPRPAILIRTPYGRRGAANLIAGLFAWLFATEGYHVLCQDVRGRFDSEGDYIPFLNEDKDGAATIDWIGRQAWCSGAIGMWGASYLAYVQWAAAAQKPPQLKALAPIIGNANLMHYPEHGFPLDLLLRWMVQLVAMDDATLSMRERLRRINSAEVQNSLLAEAFMHLPVLTADVVATGAESALYREMTGADGNHPHWQMANHTATVAQGPPANFVGGWYDLFLDGLLDDFMAQQQAGLHSQLTVGPWFHLSLGYLPVAYQQALDWFAAQLKGEPGRLPERPVRLYMMGANCWRAFDSWPPTAQPTAFYLHGNGVAKTGRLRLEAPADDVPPDQYRYDPNDPTPNIAGPKMGDDAGATDNRAVETRSDVLIFSSVPLADPFNVVGPVQATLFVHTDRPSADFFVRLCDVDRTGRSRNVCDGNFRLEADRGEPQKDGSTRIIVAMSSTAYCFRAGHRIRIQVSSGAHPRFARNQGIAGLQSISTELEPAEQTLYHDRMHPSALQLPVLGT